MQTFPDDENGSVLRRMHEGGDDLSRPRQVDFTVVLPDEPAARTLSCQFEDLGYRVAFKRTATVSELPWDVVISKVMVPNHSAITAFENELQTAAEALGGRNDGWGCFERIMQ